MRRRKRASRNPERPKVLFVINSLGTGGAERSLAELLPGLADAGIATVVVCLNRRREGVEEQVTRAGFDVRFLGAGGLFSRVRALRKIMKAESPDMVHTTIFESDVAGRIAAVGSGAVVATSLVNTTYDPVRLRNPRIRPWRLAAARTLDGWTARHLTDRFHAITAAVKEASVSALGIGPERVTVIERGRDPERLGTPGPERRRRARAVLDLAEEDGVLVGVGRQEFQKGGRYLLEAMEMLAEPRPVLLVAGRRGDASAELERLRERPALRDRVRFLGHRDDVPELLAAADVFVFPSLYEGLGGAVIEAMALGLPIVASDLPAIREVLEEGRNALLVEPGSSTALAAALDEMVSDTDRARAFGTRSREIFEERFTLERSTRRMVAWYRSAAGAGGLLADPSSEPVPERP